MTIQQLMMGGKNIATTPTVLFLTNTATTSWTVPTDWNDSIPGPDGYANKIEVIGGGGSGGNGGSDGAGGGGGGGYSAKNNFPATPGTSVPYSIGAGGIPEEGDGGDTWFGSTVYASAFVAAKGGLNPPGGSTANKEGGAGGQASAGIGDIKYTGARGRDQGASSTSGGGGGGAAGPAGNAPVGGGISATGVDAAGGPGTGGTTSSSTSATMVQHWTQTSNGAKAGPGGGGYATHPGSIYGGGGGGEGSAGEGDFGAQGIIVISYYPILT